MTRNGLLAIVLLAVLGAVGAALFLLREPSRDDGRPLGAEPTQERTTRPMDLAAGADERGMVIDTPPREGGAGARPMLDETDLPARVLGEVVDRTGHGVAGARIALLLVEEAGLARSYVTTAIATESDETGRFDLVGVPAERTLVVEARAEGFAPVASASFRVEPAGKRDVGRLLLERGTKLTGRVTDTAQAPLEGALVRVEELGRADGTSGEPVPVAEALSDAQGRYVVEGLATRQYRLSITREGYAEVDLVLSFVLGRADTWVQDVELELADSELGGVVFSSDDRPVPGLELRILRRRAAGASYSTATVTTADDGTFRFPPLAAGRYDLDVLSSQWYLGTPDTLEAGYLDHRVRVHPALAVVGRMVTETGAPLPRTFEVTARPDGRTGAGLLDPSQRVRRFERADPPGVFRFDGLTPGTYQFSVAAAGFAATTSQDVQLGGSVREVEVVIPLLAGGTLLGRVAPPPETPARVELREASWDPSLPLEHAFPTAPLPGLVAKVAPDGSFRLAHVPEGSYVLTLRAQGLPAVHLRDVAVVEGGTSDAGVLTLRAGGSVFGTVTGIDGQPLAGAPVTITGEGHHERLNTDPAGTFRFEAVPPGTYDLVSTPPGLFEALKFEARGSVEVRPETESEVPLVMGERVRER